MVFEFETLIMMGKVRKSLVNLSELVLKKYLS
jgi:hypothetical protein